MLKEINKQAQKHNRTIPCLLQIKIAKEESKFGLSFEDAKNLLSSEELKQLKNVNIVGLMGMSTNTTDESQIRNEFKELNKFYLQLKATHPTFTTLSMGMSGDYNVALQEGSTMVRIGSTIFGSRAYN